LTLLKTIKKIEMQQKIIQQLEEENKYLKEQMALCGGEKAVKKNELKEKNYLEFCELRYELDKIKGQYQKLISDLRKDKRRLRFTKFISI